jgi:Tfp pilus assembly protein PilN
MSKTIREEQKASAKKPSPVERIARWFEGELRLGPKPSAATAEERRSTLAEPPAARKPKPITPAVPKPTAAQLIAPAPTSHGPKPMAHTESFSINFLRHETVPRFLRRALVYAAIGYLAVNLVVSIVIVGMTLEARSEWTSLRAEVEQGLHAPVEAAALTKDMLALQDRFSGNLERVSALVALQQQRFPVGGRLAALTRTVPPRTWITAVSGEREGRKLTISASYLVDPDKPYELPTKAWIEALRADPRFSQGLKRLDLGSTSRKTQGTAELLAFDLAAEWGAPGLEDQAPAAKPAKQRRSQ